MHMVAIVVIPKDSDVREEVAKALAPYEKDWSDDEKVGWWDWWQIGGRYTGWWSDYEPEMDWDNVESCTLCLGTGVRSEMDSSWCGGCNGCRGLGWRLRWPSEWVAHEHDVLPVRAGLSAEVRMPYTVVTPLGAWHKETWTGGDFVQAPEWHRVVREALTPYADDLAVVVDYHA